MPLKTFVSAKQIQHGHAELWQYRTHWMIKRFRKGADFPEINVGKKEYIHGLWKQITKG